MRIGLHDADAAAVRNRTFPNYALMKLAAWHKQQGNRVEWWQPLGRYDAVYSSKVFSYTPENPYLPVDAIRGGTGYDIKGKLPKAVDDMFPDYMIYPNTPYAIGYITRGCPNHCRWCIVPGIGCDFCVFPAMKSVGWMRFSAPVNFLGNAPSDRTESLFISW